MKKIDLTGKTFGLLTVVNEVKTDNKNIAWMCKCKCGNKKTILGSNLTGGRSKSCGCLQKENASKASKTHGGTKTRLYNLYKGMKQRCTNLNSPAYKYYGGRGIVICDEWLNDFQKFKDWCLNNQYSDEKSIDRIDPNGNYCPENCRWVSFEKQQNNKLNSAFISINDQKKTVAEWAKENGINKQTLYSKIYRLLKDLKIKGKNVKIKIEVK